MTADDPAARYLIDCVEARPGAFIGFTPCPAYVLACGALER